jgi:hypothetical protein
VTGEDVIAGLDGPLQHPLQDHQCTASLASYKRKVAIDGGSFVIHSALSRAIHGSTTIARYKLDRLHHQIETMGNSIAWSKLHRLRLAIGVGKRGHRLLSRGLRSMVNEPDASL